MDNDYHRHKKLAVTAAICIVIFVVFSILSVTLAFTWAPIFSLLILGGLIASSIAANLYWTQSHQRCADHPSEQELEALHVDDDSSALHCICVQNVASSAPCLLNEQTSKPRRSFSSPSLAGGVPPPSTPPEAEVHDDVSLKEYSEDCSEVDKDVGNLDDNSAGEMYLDNVSDTVSVEEKIQNDEPQDQETCQGVWPVTSSETRFVCSPEAPASWTDIDSAWGNLSPASVEKRVNVASGPEDSESAKGESPAVSEHSCVFGSARTMTQMSEAAGSCGSFWNDYQSYMGPNGGFKQGDNVCSGTDDEESQDEAVTEAQAGPDGSLQKSPEEAGGILEESTLSLIKQKSEIASLEKKMDEAEGCLDKRLKKKSKRRLKLIPRFLKGKKKEFSRFN